MKLTKVLLILLLLCHTAYGQSDFVAIKGLPTKEVFDLLVDKKGFLWVAHNLGVSRYDGISFTHFSHPRQSALSMTDLIEDPQGRIWCHNFNSQVFYIEGEKMHLLQAYEYSKEVTFPRMVLLHDEIVITTYRGLFVCNTKTLQSKYLHVKNADTAITHSIVRLKDRVITSELNNWFTYDQKKGFLKITHTPNLYVGRESYFLSPASHSDTFYLVTNPRGWLYKLVYKNDSVNLVNAQDCGSFINSTSLDQGKVWINTTQNSRSSDNSRILKGFNVSDHVSDLQGNHWIGTLDQGLLVNYKTSALKKVSLLHFTDHDFIQHLGTFENYFVIGTKNGQLLLQDRNTKQITWQYSFPSSEGGIKLLRNVSQEEFIISTSTRLFIFNARTKAIALQGFFPANDADAYDQELFIASSVGFYVMAPLNHDISLTEWYSVHKKLYPMMAVGYETGGTLVKEIRSKAIRYNPLTKTIFVSVKGELWEVGSFGMKQVYFNGDLIYATALEFFNNKMYIASLSGLLVKEKDKIRKLTMGEGLSSNTIIHMRRTGNFLWLFQHNAIQVLDLLTEKIIENLDLPQIPGSNIYDLSSVNDTAYLTTDEGVYMVLLNNQLEQTYKTYLTSILVNSKDIVLSNNFTLPYNKNSIQFNLSVPWYHPNQNLHFRYRLIGANQTGTWYTTNEQQGVIRFAALMPGEYTFESYAVISGTQEDKPLIVTFRIENPWWKQLWFVSLALLLLFAGLYIAYRARLQQVLKVAKIRQNISSDLHDEIGSTLSSINIYSELAKKEKDNKEYLGFIQNNVREVITKLDDLVWSINPGNDSFKQLISRMQLFAEPLLFGSNIRYSFESDAELFKLELNVDVKQNLYLIFKESVNNVAKHSKASHCTAQLHYKKPYVYMHISDDGTGFAASGFTKGRNGLKNMQERAKQMNASLHINAVEGKGTNIVLKVPIA